MDLTNIHRHRCCKPFRNKKCSKKLVSLTKGNQDKLNELYHTDKYTAYKKICTSCNIRLSRTNIEEQAIQENINVPVNENTNVPVNEDKLRTDTESDEPQPGPSSSRDIVTPCLANVQRDELISNINTKIIPLLEDVSPIRKKHCKSNTYNKRKSEEIANSIPNILNEKISVDQEDNIVNQRKAKYYDEIIENLKFQYNRGDDLDKKKYCQYCRLK